MKRQEYESQIHDEDCGAFPGRYPDIECAGCLAILEARRVQREGKRQDALWNAAKRGEAR